MAAFAAAAAALVTSRPLPPSTPTAASRSSSALAEYAYASASPTSRSSWESPPFIGGPETADIEGFCKDLAKTKGGWLLGPLGSESPPQMHPGLDEGMAGCWPLEIEIKDDQPGPFADLKDQMNGFGGRMRISLLLSISQLYACSREALKDPPGNFPCRTGWVMARSYSHSGLISP